MIVEIKKPTKTETHERLHPLMYLAYLDYIEGMESKAERVKEVVASRG